MPPTSQILLTALLGAIPEMLILLLALVFLIVGKHRKPAACVLVAMAVSVLMHFAWAIYHRWLFDRQMMMDWSPDQEQIVMFAGGAAQLVCRLIVLGLLLIAAFGWRKTGAAAASTGGNAAIPGSGPASAAAPFPTGNLPPISKGLYLGWIFGSFGVGLLLLVPGMFLIYADRGRNAVAGLPFVCLTEILMIVGVVVLAILIYKLWARIQGEPTTRTTPGKAIGFAFIPLFNFYWIFQVYWGWAKDYNQFVQARAIEAPRAPEGLALGICVLTLLGIIPFFGLIVGFVNLIMLAMFLNTAVDGVNAIVASTAPPERRDATSDFS